jgi:hypothetical protein
MSRLCGSDPLSVIVMFAACRPGEVGAVRNDLVVPEAVVTCVFYSRIVRASRRTDPAAADDERRGRASRTSSPF